MKIGLQLYTLRGHIKNGDDLLKILSDVKKLGFEGVEFAGYFGLDANTLRSRLDELGLSVAGTHLPVSALEGEPLDENIRFAQTLGEQIYRHRRRSVCRQKRAGENRPDYGRSI